MDRKGIIKLYLSEGEIILNVENPKEYTKKKKKTLSKYSNKFVRQGGRIQSI